VYVSPSSSLPAAVSVDASAQAVRQTVRIVSIDHPQNLLRTGDRATVVFEFIAHPEFVKAGVKLLFREGKTKVIFCERL
jgi:GTPase